MKEFEIRQQRFELRNPIAVSIDSSTRGWVLNISRSGCMVYTHAWVQVDDTRHEIALQPDDAQTVCLEGSVVRAKLIPFGKTVIYELGIAFAGDGSDNHPFIERVSTFEGQVPWGGIDVPPLRERL